MRTVKSFHETPLPNRVYYDIEQGWIYADGRIRTETEPLLRSDEALKEDGEMATYMAQALL